MGQNNFLWVLEIFNNITNIVLALEYLTPNLYFIKLFRIKKIFTKREFDVDLDLASMVVRMTTKFDNYTDGLWANGYC